MTIGMLYAKTLNMVFNKMGFCLPTFDICALE